METQDQNPVLNQDPAMEPAPQYQPNGVLPMLSFKEAVKICWEKYSDFTGRARRSEYWWFCLFSTIVLLLPFIVLAICFASDSTVIGVIAAIVICIIALALIVPSLSVQTRRLHDTGRSGWWIVWNIIASVVSSIAEIFAFGLSNYMEAATTPSDIDMLGAIMDKSMPLFIVVGLLYLLNLGISLAIFVFSLFDSDVDENKYGPSPKYQYQD